MPLSTDAYICTVSSGADALYFYIFKTGGGLRLRAVGDNPAAMDAAGVNVFRLRYLYTTIGTAIVAMGGAYLTMAHTTTYIDNVTAGDGWIASALVIFAFWNPLLAALGSFFFGIVTIISLRLQLSGVPVSSFFISMLPYVCTILVLIALNAFAMGLEATPNAVALYATELDWVFLISQVVFVAEIAARCPAQTRGISQSGMTIRPRVTIRRSRLADRRSRLAMRPAL